MSPENFPGGGHPFQGGRTPCANIIYEAKTNTYKGKFKFQGGQAHPLPPLVTLMPPPPSLQYPKFNPIPRGLWYNLFHTGGGAYMPPLWFLGKKGFWHTKRTIQNSVTQKHLGLYIKNKKKYGEWDMQKKFINISHCLPLRTKVALARPSCKLNL